MSKIRKKSETRKDFAETARASAKELQDLRVSKASAISELMRRLKQVRSSRPYTREEMNER